MTVTLRTRITCPTCQHKIGYFAVATVRINKRHSVMNSDRIKVRKDPRDDCESSGGVAEPFNSHGRSDMKTVPLYGKKAAGRVALVDDEDYDLVMQYRWFVDERERGSAARSHGPYAVANRRGYHAGTISMHKFLTGWSLVDHEDHDGLNNQRSNLRQATYAQNAQNGRSHVDSTSRFKGVCWLRKNRNWLAYINYGGKRHYLGSHASEEDAARAYDEAARREFGEFAFLNLPGDEDLAS